jgi:DNA-binding transcriptional ArsR family regulator
MAGPNLDQPLLSGAAQYQAEDWGRASASGKLDIIATAQLRRGVNVGLGAEALVEISGSVRKFLALDASAQASAAARVQAQVQVPLDLFGEAGVAIRLQAIAEAAVGISLGVGLSIGDFLALARTSPRMKGAPLKLLALLLEPNQVALTAGVKAKAAASAMAYVNFLVTGSLLGNKPGFLVAGEAGLGLKAGAGYQVFANFGLNSPHRFIRRSIDIAVDETLHLISQKLLREDQRRIVSELRSPVKMAYRLAFEFGWALAENGGAFNANAGPQYAQRLSIVILEEGQRLILEALSSFAIDAFHQLLAQAGISQANWDATQPLRNRVVDTLRKLQDDAFDNTQTNRDLWLQLIGDMMSLGAQLAAGVRANTLTATLWAALQLLFRGTERLSSFNVRAQIIGVGAHTRTQAFNQALAQQPPDPLRHLINSALESRDPNAVLSESDLVDYLAQDAILDPLLQAAPNLRSVIDILFGPSAGAGKAAIKVILREAGAFVPGGNGAPNSEATLRALLDGLRAYVDHRLKDEVLPVIRGALGNDRELALYLDEVLLPPLDLSLDLVAESALSWAQKGQLDQVALREACSGILLKLISRSLVVSLDILLNTALAQIQGEFRAAATHVDDRGGIAETLARATGLDRTLVAELLEETLSIMAETFGPLESGRREQIRSLLFQITDVLPIGNNDEFVNQLKDDFFVPNLEAGVNLAKLSGEMIAENLQRFVAALLNRVALRILDELAELLRAVEDNIKKWLGQLEALVDDLLAAALALAKEVLALQAAVESAWNDVFDGVEGLLTAIGGSGRSSVRSKVKAALVSKATNSLEANSIYANLPGAAKRFARDRLKDTVGTILNAELFDDVWDVVSSLSAEAAELVEDIRDLDFDANLTSQISSLVLDRAEDAVRDLFGGESPRISIAFHISLDLGFFAINETINLGRVTLPLGGLIDAIRDGVGELAFVENHIRAVADRMQRAFELAAELEAKTQAKEAATDEHRRVAREIAASKRADFAIEFLSPTAAGVYETSSIEVEIFLKQVPMSFLGLGDLEQDRVFIFLNHEPLDLSAFVVEEEVAAEDADAPALNLAGRIDTSVVASGGMAGLGIVGRNVRHTALRYQPGAPVGPWGQTLLFESGKNQPRDRLNQFRRQQGSSTAPALDTSQQVQFKARSAQAASTQRGVFKNTRRENLAMLGRGFGARTRDPLSSARKPRPLRNLPSLGRVLNVRGRLDRREALGPGMLLRLRLPVSRFVEGINAMVVSVVPGHGARIEQAVSFMVSPGEREVSVQPPRPPKKPHLVDLPIPEGLRGYAGNAKPLNDADRKPQKAMRGWHPVKKERLAKIAETTAVHQKRAQKKLEMMADRGRTSRRDSGMDGAEANRENTAPVDAAPDHK